MFTVSKLLNSKKIRIITYKDDNKNIFFSKIIKYDFSSRTKRDYLQYKYLVYDDTIYEGIKKEYLMYKYLVDRNNNSFENFNIYEEIKIKDVSEKVELNFDYKDKKYCIELDICDLLDYEADEEDKEDKGDENNSKENIDKICIIISDYDNTKIRFYDYFLKDNTLNDIFNNINNILLKLKGLHELNFIHGDFHTSNILIDSNNNISFIDPEFSLILDNNNIIIDDDIQLINLYLKLDDGYQLTNNFLKIFDIYLLVIHIYRYRYNKLSFLENIYYYIISNNISDDYFSYFYLIYHQVFYYVKKFGNIEKIMQNINLIASFKIIKKIVLKKFEKIKNINYETNVSFIKIHEIFEELYEINK